MIGDLVAQRQRGDKAQHKADCGAALCHADNGLIDQAAHSDAVHRRNDMPDPIHHSRIGLLGGRAPGDRYRGSPRPYPAHLPPLEYPGHFLVKRVTYAGTFRFKHRLLFIANALKQHHIGLEEIDNGIWSIYFNRVLLARLDERDYLIRG